MHRSSSLPQRTARWPLLPLILLAGAWLALLAGTVALAKAARPAADAITTPLPDLRSSLHLPYFSFARALRPGS
ncbi:MAG: hypothetical protein ACI4NW_09625 [Stenotrophomonas sp.]